MITNRQIVSEIANDLKAFSMDDRVSTRYILSKLRFFNALFLKRENEQLRLYDDNNVWFLIECLEMERIDNTIYSGIPVAKDVGFVRSRMPIPSIYSTKNGPLIRELNTLDSAGYYQPTTPKEYRNVLKREYQNKNIRYFWFDGDNRLVIPDSFAEKVSLTASFIEPYLAQAIDSCNNITCNMPLDDPFLCPAHLISVVKSETLKELMNAFKRIVTDDIPDGDESVKTELQTKDKRR